MFSPKLTLNSSIFISFVFIIIIIGAVIFLEKFDSPDSSQIGQMTRVHFVDNMSKAHEALIKKFNKIYSGQIEVIPIHLPFSKFSTNERKELLARSLRSKSDGIDIFAVDLIWVPRFARWSEPLDVYFPSNDRVNLSRHAMESCFFNGHMVAAPFYLDIGLMYYRKDLLNQIPDGRKWEERIQESVTWKEFIELSKKFPDKKEKFYLYAAKDFEGLVCSFIEGIKAQDKDVFQRKPIELNTPEGIKILSLLVDMVDKYKMTPPIVTKFDEVQNYLYALKHDALFFRGWPGFLRQHDDQSTMHKLEHIGIAPLPHFEGYPKAFIFGGWNLMISKFSKKKLAALTFIKFVLEEENQRLLFDEGGLLGVNKNLYRDNDFLRERPILRFYQQVINDGIHRPYMVNYTKISDVLSYYTQKAIEKEISVEEALEEATKKINSNETFIK